MKKVLFATTALIATAGMASADITWGGFGRFGIVHADGAANENRIEQRFRLTITGKTESDAGVKFEGRIRFQADDNADGTSSLANSSAPGFAVTSGGIRVDVGNVSNVIDSGDAANYYGYGVGMTGFVDNSTGMGLPAQGFGTQAFSSEVAGATVANSSTNTVKLRYSAGDLTASVSYQDDANEATQVGVGYSFGNYSAGIVAGQSDVANTDFVAASLSGEVGALAFNVLVTDNDARADNGVSVTAKYAMSAATELRFAYSDGGAAGEEAAMGVGFIHQLGGGVSLRGGVGEGTDGNTDADLGVVFNF